MVRFSCAICGRRLKPDHTHVDTCGERCYKRLLVIQRRQLAAGADNYYGDNKSDF